MIVPAQIPFTVTSGERKVLTPSQWSVYFGVCVSRLYTLKSKMGVAKAFAQLEADKNTRYSERTCKLDRCNGKLPMGSRLTQRFCTDQCRIEYNKTDYMRKAKVLIKCAWCGVKFPREGLQKAPWCSPKCKDKILAKRKHAKEKKALERKEAAQKEVAKSIAQAKKFRLSQEEIRAKKKVAAITKIDAKIKLGRPSQCKSCKFTYCDDAIGKPKDARLKFTEKCKIGMSVDQNYSRSMPLLSKPGKSGRNVVIPGYGDRL